MPEWCKWPDGPTLRNEGEPTTKGFWAQQITVPDAHNGGIAHFLPLYVMRRIRPERRF